MIFTPIFYRKAGWLTCFSIFLLVLLGGIVRASGSGMGCPDWPKCFGQYIPPTNASQLPENYKEIFTQKRIKKVERYTKLLHQLGMHQKAEAIANDPYIKREEPFSAKTTWIEYINRLFGALTGLFALATFISSFQFIKKNKQIFLLTLAGIIAVLFNGWMGSIVVATNLLPGTITIHYLAAFLAAGLFMWPITIGGKNEIASPQGKKTKTLIYVLFLVVLVQTITGTWSREIADGLLKNNNIYNTDYHLNLKGMGFMFVIHRYLSIVVLALVIYLFRLNRNLPLSKIIKYLLVIIISQIIAGSINIWYILPPVAQTYHIFAGGIILGLIMYLCSQFLKKSHRNIHV